MGDDQSSKLAYATVITRASYLAGVVILAYTLKDSGSRFPLVVLYTASLHPDALKALELEAARSNMIIRQCDQLYPPRGVNTQLIAERFEDTWTKLRVFELTGFDIVCYLDADMAILKNPDSIFAHAESLPPDWIIANHACVCNIDRDPWAPDDWRSENCAYTKTRHPLALTKPNQPSCESPRTHHLLNGGMFIFSPSQHMWTQMMRFFNSTSLLAGFQFPDQDFLAHFFQHKWFAVGWQYNALKTMRYIHPNIWRDEEVVCLHYIVDKPWAKVVDDDGSAGFRGRDGVTHQLWWDVYLKWELSRLADESDGTSTVMLMRRWVADSNCSWSTRKADIACKQ